MSAKYPGIPTVIHGNGAVAEVMGHVCGGVIGYPITPSTEISELYEAFRAGGGCNVWGKHPFFFEPEGEHSAQSGALGAALTGGKYISNASSSQGILYGLESHYVTVGKKVGGFVLQVAARVVSRHSLNVMAGHDDVYALLQSGYTILFGSNPQEAADLAAISYKVSAQSLIPVANAMDGFATSHMMSAVRMPEPELLREFLGDPAGRVACPTVAQEILFGAKGRVFQLKGWMSRHREDFTADAQAALAQYLDGHAEAVEHDAEGALVEATLPWVPEELRGAWRRQWLNAHEKGTRQRVPALVDVNNPGLTGGVQNQPDFQAGSVDHRTHFVSEVPRFVREAMREYAALTGREYQPVQTFMCDDAEHVVVGLGSVTDDAEAVAEHLRRQGRKVGVVSVKLLQPFPEAELVAALVGKKAVTVLERSEATQLMSFVTQALFKGLENAQSPRHPGIPALPFLPKMTTAIFGLGAHDLQPRHLVAAFRNMETRNVPFVYLGSQFFAKNPPPQLAALQARLKAAYPETEWMALETEPNPVLLPPEAIRLRFHSIGGYGTIATGKLITDILAGVLGMHSKAAPKYGSEKSGAPTNYYITLSPEPVKITNAELEDVEVVISPDHRVFGHTNPLRGLVKGGSFILQSALQPLEVWKELPEAARRTLREKKIQFLVLDGFEVAKRHAPTPELETRMMGIAFIGAVCGHVERITAGADEEALLAKIRSQIAKKFGGKGGAVVEGNLAVMREGLEATRRVDYDLPEFRAIDAEPAPLARRSVSISAHMCRVGGATPEGGFFDRDYYEQMMAAPFREGTVAEAPVLPGTGMFMPAGTAAWKDKGLFRRDVPEFVAELCTGCMECTLVCPDAAIPNTVHDLHDLLLTGIRQLDLPESERGELTARVYPLTEAVRERYRATKDSLALHELVAEAAASLDAGAAVRRNVGRLAELLRGFPVARTKPFFDAPEKDKPGSGGLYSVAIDPWKCSGCMECIDVCGPGALKPRVQDGALLEVLQERFEFLSRTSNTPPRFVQEAVRPGGDIKRMMLDRANYYATTGGHGACRGCGEVTAIRLVMSANHAIQGKRRKDHVVELEQLIGALRAKRAVVQDDAARCGRIESALATLERRLYLLESGPTGNGPASAVIANATGCSSVYASTFPFNPYNDPWVNSLFQDTPAVAKGLFEGLTASAVDDVKALRVARLELEDAYEPAIHDRYFRTLGWSEFTPQELAMLPTAFSVGGDGATYDIGFGALSRLLATSTPIKVMVLNTGVYSNTGGQASTASLTGQDSDLTRFGAAHAGKQEDRKELGLIAAFHPNVFVVQTSTALQGHFLGNVMEYLNYTASPAVLDVYTPCQAEHGISDAAASRRSRLAVESRMNPVFVHDPRRGRNLHDRFLLDGNPAIDSDWASTTMTYVDEDGSTKLREVPLTPADFAREETRFKKQFRRLQPDAEARAVPVHEYIDLPAGARAGKVPFVWSVDDQRHLEKLEVSNSIVHLVEERRRNWRSLQYLAGRHVERLDADHHFELEALQKRYQESVTDHESSLDSIARAMSELAAASSAPPAALATALAPFGGGGAVARPMPAGDAATAGAGDGAAAAGLMYIREEDVPKCVNCKTCYQQAPELFEMITIVDGGVAKEVGHMVPGVMSRIKATPELVAKVAKIAANCDSEIIR